MQTFLVALLAKFAEALVTLIVKLVAKFVKQKEDQIVVDAQVDAILEKTDKKEAASDLNDLFKR